VVSAFCIILAASATVSVADTCANEDDI